MSSRRQRIAPKQFGGISQLAMAVSVFIWQSHASQVQAEPCWMIGCSGRIGYILMPDEVYPPAKKLRYQMDGKDCAPPLEKNPFGTHVLPDVNSVTSIEIDNVSLVEEKEIVSHLGSFSPLSITKDINTGECRATRITSLDVAGDLLKAGAKVKILGYRIFVSQRSETGSAGAVTRHEQILFALVVVQTDIR